MKPIARLASLAALSIAAQPAVAAPLLSLGDGVDVFFNGTATLQYVDNLFYADKAVGGVENDWVFLLRPGLELRAGRPGTPAQFTLWVENEWKTYISNPGLDRDNLSLRSAASYNTDRSKISGRASFVQTDQSTFDIRQPGQLVLRDVSTVDLRLEHDLSAKTIAAIGFGYYQQDFRNGPYLDHEHASIPVDLYYRYSPKLDLSVGYRWRDTNVSGGTGSKDQFLNVGARGELLPKVTGAVRIGTQRRSPDVGSSSSTLAVNTDLAWAASPKTVVNLSVDRDFGTSSGGFSTRSLRTGVSVDHQFSSFVSGHTFVTLINTDYANGREDETFAGGFSFTYAPTNFLRFAAGYTYQENDGNALSSNYENHILNFSASLRY